MPRKKKSAIEREQASSMVNDWEKDNGGLDDNQRATLQRMIELNSNTAQQDVRRVDYYSGNEKKYERSTQPIQVRNENTGSLVKKKKEVFALKEGQEEEPLENVYQNLAFDKNNEDHRKPPERNPFLDQIKAANSISQSTSTDWMKQQEEASRTNRMMSTIDRIAKKPPSQEGGFLDDLKFAAGKFGEMIKPPEGKTRQEVWDEYMKDGGKSRGTKEVNRFANRAMDSTLLNAPSAAMKKVRGQDAVDWQDHREGVGENVADFVSTGIGYVLPGAGAANVAGKLGMAAKVGENTSKLGKIGKYAKEGAVTGALLAGAETPAKAYVNPEQTVGDHFKRIGVETAAGAAITPLAHGLMNAVQNLRKTKGQTSNVSDDVIQQERHQRELTNQAAEEQALQDTRIKNEPESLPIQSELESNTFFKEYNDAVNEQYKYLKNSSGKGVEPGGIIRDELGDVVNRYGRISNNPSWYQEFYKANGRKPNNTELRELAESHVRNGYQENGVDIPSWSPSSVKKIDEQIEQATALIKQNPSDQEALQPVIDALKQEREIGLQKFYTELNGKKPYSNGELPDDVQAMRHAPPVIQSAMAPDGRTITQKKLMDSFRDNVGITIRTGRMGVGDDAVSGIYKNSPEVIRTRDYGDLETLAHETGHHLDKKFGLNDPKFDDEFMKLGAHTSGQNYTPEQIRQEGMAEFMRRYLLNPAMAEQEAPAFMKHFQNTIPEDVQKGLQKVQEDAQIWANQGDEARFRGKINVNEKPKGLERVKQVLQKLPKTKEEFYTDVMDRLYPISKAEKEILGGELADASSSPYKKARLAAGTPKKAQMKVEEFRNIFGDSNVDMADIRDYVTAIHAQDLEKQGIKTGFTPEEIEKTITKFDKPEIQEAHQKIKEYNDSLLDMLVDGQMLSKDAVAAMREKHPNYMPFNRYFDEEGVGEGFGGGKGFVDVTNPVKRIEGSSRNVIDPFESIVKNTFKSMQAIERNKVGLSLADLAEKEGAGKWIERLAGDGKESVAKENIVTVFRNGEKEQYQLAPELYRAVKAMDKEVTNKFILAASKPSDWLRAGATLTPEFALRNPIRDQFAAYVVSDTGYNPFDFVKGLKEVGKKKFGKGSELYDDWVKQGGAYGGYLSADRDLLKEQLSGLEKQESGLPKAIQAITAPINPKNWLKVLQNISEVSEEATKVGAYHKGLKKGLTPEESAYQARDLMDFNRMGNSMQSANRVFTFLNANLQGKDKLIRSMKEHPIRTSARIAGSTLPPSALAIASYANANDKQKEMMDNMPGQEKDTYWSYAIPGTDKVGRIPKPFDISLLANTVERANKYREGDQYAFDGFDKTVNDAVKVPWIPTTLQPIVENMANYSFFRDGPIVPKRDEKNSPKEQYGPNRSLTAREMASALDKIGIEASPYKIDNVYKGYTAGLGQFPLKGLDRAISLLSNKDVPTPIAQEWNESTPGAKAFFVNGQGGGQVMEDYYNIMDEQQAIQADSKKNEEDASNAEEMKAFNRIDRDMAKLRKEYYVVKSDTAMNPEVKRSELDRLDEEMRALAREGITIFRPDYK
ncbi:4'-phosphopantetheinyl transferase [Bacillus thuringiensis]|nr:4'-phosphopantetheinyl transferase [Bacillus thuringiensis]MED2760034.1 4'-phosphopantetheinyl transferase [Bacillus thuringiensis]MED2769528.1 4'-phosphopantetheinyl transferase [Bacillus thuringiensis]MED2772906.1 4'-phosphopantetheinyl transferase [Bacillus thuringiensis]